MSVKPYEGCGLVDLKGNIPTLTWVDWGMAAPVLNWSGDSEPVPVKSCDLWQVVDQVNVDGLAPLEDHRLTQQGTIVAPGLGLLAWQELDLPRLRHNRVVHIRGRLLIRLQQVRNI